MDYVYTCTPIVLDKPAMLETVVYIPCMCNNKLELMNKMSKCKLIPMVFVINVAYAEYSIMLRTMQKSNKRPSRYNCINSWGRVRCTR